MWAMSYGSSTIAFLTKMKSIISHTSFFHFCPVQFMVEGAMIWLNGRLYLDIVKSPTLTGEGK